MNKSASIATRVAMGFVVNLLDPPFRLGDVRMFTHGRLHFWDKWIELEEGVKQDIANFTGLRPGLLTEDNGLLTVAREILLEASDFEIVGSNDAENLHFETEFRLVAGSPLGRRIDQWFQDLRKAQERSVNENTWASQEGSFLNLISSGISYRVPRMHLPEGQPAYQVKSFPFTPEIQLEVQELRTLAKKIDAAKLPGPQYEMVAVDNFLGHFYSPSGHKVHTLRSGPTSIAIAPTGTGKSVFARLVAINQASHGMPTCLVVPDIASVWKEALRIEAIFSAIGLDLSVAPLSSWRNLAKQTALHLEHPQKSDPKGAWVLKSFGYSCLLSAYTESWSERPEAGSEPCTKLRIQNLEKEKKDQSTACPFSATCGRFQGFEKAFTSDIIVVNHDAFLSGRVPFRVEMDGNAPRKITTAELVLRKCGLVLIDELDELQKKAISMNSRGLTLSSRGSLSMPYQLLTEVDRRRAEGRLDSSVRFERGRSALLRIIHQTERLAELINRKELKWSEGDRMTWQGAKDGWMGRLLFPNHPDPIKRLQALFDRDPINNHAQAESLRLALSSLAGPGLDDGTTMEEIRAEILKAIQGWDFERRHSQKDKDLLADRLVVKGILLLLTKALSHLRPQLPGLEQRDVDEAARLRDALLGYAPWQPSPAGSLGHRLFGFTFSGRSGEQGALETKVFGGDPHGLISELGDLVARALAGCPRAVIGLSATCRFRGAPSADVLGRVVGAVHDKTRNVQVLQAAGETRVSGVSSGASRLEAARVAAKQLWNSTLESYLSGLMAETATCGRARALIVTGSYAEAQAVGEELRLAVGKVAQVRHLVKSASNSEVQVGELPRNQIESFADIPAPAILAAPLALVSRGHNIVQKNTNLSAISGIFVLTRPVPPSDDPERFLAHISYNARLFPPAWEGNAHEAIAAERKVSRKRLHKIQGSRKTFRHMDPVLRRELVCDVLVELAQLAGRARRGGTPVDLVFVDAAFQDDVAPWRDLVKEVLDWWRERGWINEMTSLHGAFVHGLREYSGFDIREYDQNGSKDNPNHGVPPN